MFKPKRVMIGASDFTQAKRAAGPGKKEVFQRDGNTVERYVCDNGSAFEKVSQPSGRHWYVFVPRELAA